jgi:predicted nucleic acid-binding protein
MKAGVTDRIVVDASIVLAWGFDDESSETAEKLLDLASAGAELVVPSIWPFEVANAVLVAERRKRISTAQAKVFLGRVSRYLVSVEETGIFRAFGEILALAGQHSLTVYDAAYLELALRENLPFATLDNQLRRAARHIGIALL